MAPVSAASPTHPCRRALPAIGQFVVLGLLVLIGLSAAACTDAEQSSSARSSTSPDDVSTNGAETTDTDTRSGDTGNGDSSDSSDDDSDSSDGARPRTPLNLPATAPGTDAAMQALFADLRTHLADPRVSVPWPDLRNPDPRMAYESAAVFQRFISEQDPNPILVEGYTAPASPEREYDLELFADQQQQGLVWAPSVPPYEMEILDLVHPADSGVPPWILDRVPDGSVAVLYLDSWGRTDLLDQRTGAVLDSLPGWANAGPWAAIMAPTDVGWQVWYDELTDPPLLLPPSDDADPSQNPNRSSPRL